MPATLRRSLSRYLLTPALAARKKRVRYLDAGDLRYRLRQRIRVARAIRIMSRRR